MRNDRTRAAVRAIGLALAASGCSAADARGGEGVGVLPDLAFEQSDGPQLRLSSYAGPSGAPVTLLVIRSVTAWCGPCQWSADNTRSLIPEPTRDRVRVVDVLSADEDNGAPDSPDLEAWAARSAGAAVAVADPYFSLSQYLPERAALPIVALVGARDRSLRRTLAAPDPDTLVNGIVATLAELDGSRPPPPVRVERFDQRFTRDQWEMIRSMELPRAASDDPSNAYASDPNAVALGRSLFFDKELSPSPKQVACSTCHAQELRFQDGRDRPAEGVGSGLRNVPSVVLAPDQRWQLWDGRADSAWAQATIPFEDPNEIASSRLFIAHAIARKYSGEYIKVFGELPPLEDTERFPASGGPGSEAWEDMSPEDQILASRVLANVGKAIAAYERSLWPEPNALDRYAAGDLNALSEEEKDGLAAFFDAGCAQCHHGPRLTDDSFHVLRFPTGRPDRAPDPGRSAGLQLLARSDFLRSGVYSDAGPVPLFTLADNPRLEGAFKTPGLRGVAFTLPYGHGGSFGGLRSVLEAHRSGGLPEDSPYAVGRSDFALPEFNPALIPKLIAFLSALTLDLPH